MEVFKCSPFGKLKHRKYLISEVLQYSGFIPQATQWLHVMNQESRAFLSKNYNLIQRDYDLEGLQILTLNLTYESSFQSYLCFQEAWLKQLRKGNSDGRRLWLDIRASERQYLASFLKVVENLAKKYEDRRVKVLIQSLRI